MQFKLIPVNSIPVKVIKVKEISKRVRIKRHVDDVEIAYLKRITGRDTTPSIRR